MITTEKTIDDFEAFLVSILRAPIPLDLIEDFYNDITFFDSDVEYGEEFSKDFVLDTESLSNCKELLQA